MIKESALIADDAVFRETVAAGDYFMQVVNKGQTCLLYTSDAADELT